MVCHASPHLGALTDDINRSSVPPSAPRILRYSVARTPDAHSPQRESKTTSRVFRGSWLHSRAVPAKPDAARPAFAPPRQPAGPPGAHLRTHRAARAVALVLPGSAAGERVHRGTRPRSEERR